MNLIRPSFEILTDNVGEIEVLQLLEKVARTCYKSEDKITLDGESAKRLVKLLLSRNHEAMLEFYDIIVKFTCDRGVSHEIVRHRIASYAQECVSGDSILKIKGNKQITIKDLYERQNGSNFDKTHNKTLYLKSIDEKTNKILSNKFVKVFFKGKQEVYEIKTKLGYNLKCTLNHRFFNEKKGYSELKNLNIGDRVYVNGRPCLLKLTDEELIHLYNNVGLSPIKIAEDYTVPYSTVVRKLKQLNVFENHKNDSNKSKYNKNHNKESYSKMRQTVLDQYKNGRWVWNKNLKESESNSVKKQADALRKNHNNNGFGELNSNWGGGKQNHKDGHTFARCKKQNISRCELCGSVNKLEVHHKDGNSYNNDDENLIKVCCKCHNLLHHGWHVGEVAFLDEITEINLVGLEDTYDIEMKDPYHNYIVNGFVTHNSTRYVNYAVDGKSKECTFIIPEWISDEQIDLVQKTNGKNYFNVLDTTLAWYTVMSTSEQAYNELIRSGWKPEQARSVLPNSTKTEINVKMNLRALRHFFDLRCSSAAHPQMRELTIPLLKEIHSRIPLIFDDLYKKYVL